MTNNVCGQCGVLTNMIFTKLCQPQSLLSPIEVERQKNIYLQIKINQFNCCFLLFVFPCQWCESFIEFDKIPRGVQQNYYNSLK